MKTEVTNLSDHMALLERMAKARFNRPYTVVVDWLDGRTTSQNSLLWAALTDVSQQVEWHGQKLTNDDWKDVFTAALRQQRAIPGIDGGVVFLGLHTSKLSKAELSDLMEIIFSFGAENGVKFKETHT